MWSDVGVKRFLQRSLEGGQHKQLGILVKLRRQKCGLRLEYQFLELPQPSTANRVTSKQQEFIVSLFWRLQVPNPGAGRAVLSRGESFPPAYFTGLPWCSLASSCTTVVSVSDVTGLLSPCLSESHKNLSYTGCRVTLLQSDLILT